MRKPDDDDMAADLRAMFADERMSLPVGQDAVSSVVAGAGRRRRRRTIAVTTGGALGVAAVLLAGGLLASHLVPSTKVATGGPGGGLATTSNAQTPAPSAGQSLIPAPTEPGTGPESEPGVLGPDGYGSLALGMTLPQALATKEINSQQERLANGCYVYTYKAAEVSRPAVSTEFVPYYVYVDSAKASGDKTSLGVEAIKAPTGVLTPEGIGTGSTEADIRAAYPTASAARGSVITAPVPTNGNAEYRFVVDAKGTVTGLYLTLIAQTCVT